MSDWTDYKGVTVPTTDPPAGDAGFYLKDNFMTLADSALAADGTTIVNNSGVLSIGPGPLAQGLDCGGYDITNVASLTATSLSGDGTSLTGVMHHVADDTSPTLGGDVTANGHSIAASESTPSTIGSAGQTTFYGNGSHLTGIVDTDYFNLVGSAYIGGDQTGNTRGSGALDISSYRASTSQVASGNSSVVVGFNCVASNTNSVAVGNNGSATGVDALMFGFNCLSSGNSSSALGWAAHATGDYSTSVGYDNIASAAGSTAIGYQVNNSTANCVEIGAANASKARISANGLVMPATNSDPGCFQNSQIVLWLDESGNNLKATVKYSNGTTKHATIALT